MVGTYSFGPNDAHNLDHILMTNTKYRHIKRELQSVIAGRINLTGDGAIPFSAIRAAIRRSRVPEMGGEHSPSSALNPVASDYWGIGIFGSVWLDVEVQGKLYRVAWTGGNTFDVAIVEGEDDDGSDDEACSGCGDCLDKGDDRVGSPDLPDPPRIARRLYTCCPEAGCSGFRDSLSFLHAFGIEPSMEIDDDGHHYFEFTIPMAWSIDAQQRFNSAIAERVASEQTPCDNCGNVMYSAAWWATCKICKERFLLCEECMVRPISLCQCARDR